MLARAASSASPPLPLRVLVQSDATVASSAFSFVDEKATLLLLPLRLDPNARLGSTAAIELLALMALRQCVGAVAGTPGHSLCILPTPGGSGGLLALDPHRVQSPAESSEELAASFRATPGDVRAIEATDLDSSLSLGFYIRDEEDYEDFRRAASLASATLAFVVSRAELIGSSSQQGEGALSPALHRQLTSASQIDDEWVDAAAPGLPPLPSSNTPSLRERVWRWMLSFARSLRSMRHP